MPLHRGHSQRVIGENVSEMEDAGHPRNQAIAAALDTARRHPKADGGWTVNEEGDTPHAGYMVSLPGHEQIIPRSQTRPDERKAYTDANEALLHQHANYFGGWQDHGKTYMDAAEPNLPIYPRSARQKQHMPVVHPHKKAPLPMDEKSRMTRAPRSTLRAVKSCREAAAAYRAASASRGSTCT